MNVQEVRVPDIGDFSDVAIIEIHVVAGDAITVDDPIITLESDKATMDVPAEIAGTVTALSVSVGDTVSQGDVILSVEVAEGAAAPATEAAKPAVIAADTDGAQPAAAPPSSTGATPAPAPPPAVRAGDFQAEVLVLGSGPGGYSAAFRAADLGAKVVLVERYPTLGGVCLNVGCIPSKALLHAAKVIAETKEMAENGISFGPPSIEVDKLRGWKDSVVTRLTSGVSGLAKRRNVEVITGVGRFSSPNTLDVETDNGTRTVGFDNAIIAAGSESAELPFIPQDDPRVITSTGALELQQIPERMLVVGGGIIGLEMAAVYYQLGTRVTVVELLDQLIPGTDADIIAPLHKMITKQYENIFLRTKVTAVDASDSGLTVHFDGPKAPETDTFDQILVAVGRQPNGAVIGADRAGVIVDSRGFISVDKQQRTNVPHIFAIGDIVGQPMLAHKATHEAKLAAEVAAGQKREWVARVIPSVAYTDPEVAWVGLTETEAKKAGVAVETAKFPWAASGRAVGLGRSEGFTKLVFDEESHRIIGGGIVGVHAGELIAEIGLAIEMGCEVHDIGHTIHPHPTLSESVGMAAEVFDGSITDLYIPRKK